MTDNGKRKTLSVYEKPEPARIVLAKALGITVDEARLAVVALIEAGYGIGPRNPTNGMLAGYLEATKPPTHHEGVITAIGKARVRWQAMLQHGTEMALSLKYAPAQGIEAGTDETLQAAQPEGQEPGPKDAPEGAGQ